MAAGIARFLPNRKLAEARADVEKLQQEFEAARARFADNYSELRDNALDEWRDAARNLAMDPEQLIAQLEESYSTIFMSAPPQHLPGLSDTALHLPSGQTYLPLTPTCVIFFPQVHVAIFSSAGQNPVQMLHSSSPRFHFGFFGLTRLRPFPTVDGRWSPLAVPGISRLFVHLPWIPRSRCPSVMCASYDDCD